MTVAADLAVVTLIVVTYLGAPATFTAAHIVLRHWQRHRTIRRFLYRQELAEIDAWLDNIRRTA